jgi:AraC-like DNA-binding protein
LRNPGNREGNPIAVCYRQFRPPAALAPVVERLWILEGPANEIDPEPIPPDGRPEIIVHGGDCWAERDSCGVLRRQSRTLFAGQLTRPMQVVPRGYARIAGAHLRPQGGFDLLHVPQHRYTDCVVDLRSIDPALANRLNKEVACHEDARAMAAKLAQVLVARVRPEARACAATKAVSIALALKGMIAVTDLARASDVSTRQLERLFHERVGLSPKQFVRIVRFQEVLRATRAGPDSGWAAVALEHGFYDQAHFINDFKTFVGRTPGEWKINDDSLASIFSVRRFGAFFQSSRPPSA